MGEGERGMGGEGGGEVGEGEREIGGEGGGEVGEGERWRGGGENRFSYSRPWRVS